MTDTRTQILAHFRKHLIEAGYDGLSLTQLATDAGIRKPSLYHHFPGGKEELFVEAALTFIEEQHKGLVAALKDGLDLRQQLVRLARTSADAVSRTSTLEQRLFDALDRVGEEASGRVRQQYGQKVLEPVEALFAKAVADKALQGDPEFLMLSFLHLARALEMMGEPDDADRLVDLFFDGARAR